MKRILSVLLALVMVLSMIPVIASAATSSETITFDAAKTQRTSYSTSQQVWTSGKVTFTNDKASSSSDVGDYTNPVRLYQGSSVTIATAEGNLTEILIVSDGTAKYKTALENSITGTGATYTNSGNNYTVTLDGNSNSFTMSMTAQARFKSITVTCATVEAGDCTHANTETIEAKDPTCVLPGNTAGIKCVDCGLLLEGNETIEATGHTEGEGVVTAPTCTEDGHTDYTCSVCGNVRKEWVDATGHNYVDGVCSACGIAKPAGLDGKYYIAAIRSSGNYMYMTNDLGTASTKRYQIVDSGLTELPASIETVVDAQVFELVASGDGYKIKTGDQYLGWTSGNSGTLVDEASAIVATIESAENGAYNIHFAASDAERYLALNNTTGNDYFAWYKQGQAEDLHLIPVSESAEACTHANTTTNTVPASCGVAGSETVVCNDCGETVSTTEIPALEHNYVDGICSACGAEDPNAGTEENVGIVFELGTNGTATHNDGKTATTYTETVNGYTLNITNGVKMYTGAVDATGNSCIKLGTSSAVGGFSFTVSDDVTEVVISIAKYKANNTTVAVNGTNYTLTKSSNDGAYDEITVDTSSTKTVTVTTVGTTYRAMVNSITFICSEADHTCVWGEGVVTTAATCTTDGVMTYTCTVDGCTKTEAIKATGHTYTYNDTAITCADCDYNQAYTLTSLVDARAAAIAAGTTNSTSTYYIKGIVTYISDRNVYIEDATAGFLVYFTSADDAASLALGDEILVWDTVKTYNGLTETSGTTSSEFVKGSSGNALPVQTITLADLKADTANEYLCERVTIEGLTIGVLGTNYTALTAADGSTINIYKAPALSEDINENDTVTVTAIVSTYNGYQLLVNPGTAAADVVETAAGEEEVVETVAIADAKAGTAGEYYQVEGTVTYVSGRNVYIQDATGGIVVYLTANAATTQVGDNVKAYGVLKFYNGLIELDAVDETNAEFYSILSSGNAVEAQQTSIAGLLADTTNEYLAEKITLNSVYVSHYSYNSSYGNVTYTLTDGNGNTIQIYRVTVDSEAECVAKGSIVNVEAIVSSYNGYQLVTTNDKITVTGTCSHETTQLVNYVAATCTEGGYSGDTECVVCGVWTVRGEDTAALGHNFNGNGVCENDCGTEPVIEMNGAYYASFEDANAAFDGYPMKLLDNIGVDGAVQLTQNIYVDLFGFTMNAYANVEYTIFGMDSTTDSFEAEEWGYLTVSGNAAVAPVTNGEYLAVYDESFGWSFHAFSVSLTHVSLQAGADALGYKAEFRGDEMVQSKVTSFGFNMWVHDNAVASRSVENAADGDTLTLRLHSIMASNGGQLVINAEAFVTFEGVEDAVKSNKHQTTMKSTVEAVELDLEDGTTELTAAQIKSVQELIDKYESKMVGWNIDSIKAWITTEG